MAWCHQPQVITWTSDDKRWHHLLLIQQLYKKYYRQSVLIINIDLCIEISKHLGINNM